MKTKLAAILCLTAMAMLLPVVAGVNAHSVNNHAVRADGSGLPTPPFPPPPPPHLAVADGSGLPTPPFPPPPPPHAVA